MYLRGFGLVLFALVFGGGCGGSALPGRFPAESIPVPDGVDHYATTVQPDGAIGGQGVEKLASEIAAALAKRGERAEADGALAATASFALREVNEGHTLDLAALDAASRRYGFSGILISTSAFGVGQDLWRDQLEQTARNVPITRYGVSVSPSGRSAAVVYGAVEIDYEPISRRFDPGQSVTLKGRVGARFSSCHVYLTKPDGKVDEKKVADRAFEVSFPLPEAGLYQLEVMGDSPATGPVVVSNVPLYVGIAEPAAGGNAGTAVTPVQAEARMLVLLNEARRTAGLNPVVADDELREVALAHSEDMVAHNFFSHVSPSTGTPDDRVLRSGALVSAAGENIAAAPTPETAHDGLMNSPGHRANMLRPDFTHVGIGAEESPSGITVTLVFGRRPPAASVPTSAAQVEAAIVALRAGKNVPAVKLDGIYRVSAQAGADVYANGGDAEDIGKAIESALSREVNRLRASRPAACTLSIELLELSQLEQINALSLPSLSSMGVGARIHRDGKGTRLSTVFVLHGVPCK